MLFHYHYWTPYLEQMENHYLNLGFRVHQRIGKLGGEFQSFNPPLTWEDFREKDILFRIIEMKKGNVNVTFGYGKRINFEHIGFIVTKDEHDQLCQRADNMNWKVKPGERRTFISTPYGFSIELQTHRDVIDFHDASSTIDNMKIVCTQSGLENDLKRLFNKKIEPIETIIGHRTEIKEIHINNIGLEQSEDPCGVLLQTIS
ncbi:hypothetical protein [Bacillus sp. Marseille-Q3570]|uniref:hypothetical protein n=1 Tax=Bacillus sp. Marseille-Q3570 TaxID=2963522 RepID=UPI0021B7287E|nr:hypothetical protein [Bacillus sp. Marseille-Q3570]